MRKVTLGLCGGLLVVGLGGYLLSQPQGHSEDENKIAVTPQIPTETVSLSGPAQVKDVAVVGQGSSAASLPDEKNEKKESAFWQNYSFNPQLQSYSQLQLKVIMTDEEKENHRSLLQDRQFILSLQEVLLAPAETADTQHLQTVAIDLLMEALKSSSRGEALSVLKTVVSDQKIEDSSLSMEQRQAMAGIKADVIFNWASQDPTSRSDIESQLPGPVSHRIWQNVLDRQASNEAESRSIASSTVRR